MAEGDNALSELGALTRKLNYSKNSWTEVKATLERLKTWAVAEENRYDQKSVCRTICRAL